MIVVYIPYRSQLENLKILIKQQEEYLLSFYGDKSLRVAQCVELLEILEAAEEV